MKLKTTLRTLCVAFTTVLLHPFCLAQDSESAGGKEYGSPERFEKEILHFEAADKKKFPPPGAIVCIGSSSIRGWHRTIAADLAPLTIIPRGFGGSNMNDALHYTDRIVLPYKPRAVVLYEGDNDVGLGISPKKIEATFLELVAKVHKQFPECRVYFISIKPSIARWQLWPKMKEVNSLIAARCSKDKRLTFVDVASGMLNDEGKPRKDLFKKDNLHMTAEGYTIWRNALRPVLLQSEGNDEK